VTLFLETGANVNIRGWYNTTALHHAVKYGELRTAKALLEKGAEVDPVTGEGWNFRTPLHIAAQWGYIEVIEFLIQKGAEGYTPLLITCVSRFPACLERFIKENAKIDARNNVEQTCFHLAAMNGYLDILKILVDKCSDPKLINSTDIEGDTPLHSAMARKLKRSSC
jgi:uncharacterized protein